MKMLYKGKYKGITLRAQWWDYGAAAGYFITFNVQDRRPFLGEICAASMRLSAEGRMVEQLWKEIPERFPYIELDAFVVMPDHVHGILIVKDSLCGCAINRAPTVTTPTVTTPTVTTPTVTTPTVTTPTIPSAITARPTIEKSLEKTGGALGDHNPMLHDNVSRVIRWFKGRATFEIRKINREFTWQSRFYDRIIRNEQEFNRIRNYIILNPEQWKQK